VYSSESNITLTIGESAVVSFSMNSMYSCMNVVIAGNSEFYTRESIIYNPISTNIITIEQTPCTLVVNQKSCYASITAQESGGVYISNSAAIALPSQYFGILVTVINYNCIATI